MYLKKYIFWPNKEFQLRNQFEKEIEILLFVVRNTINESEISLLVFLYYFVSV